MTALKPIAELDTHEVFNQPPPFENINLFDSDRAFVDALAPTHCLKLPDEVFTHWDDRYLDQVEMK